MMPDLFGRKAENMGEKGIGDVAASAGDIGATLIERSTTVVTSVASDVGTGFVDALQAEATSAVVDNTVQAVRKKLSPPTQPDAGSGADGA